MLWWVLWPEPVHEVSWILQARCFYHMHHGLSWRCLSECLEGQELGPHQHFPACAMCLLDAALSLELNLIWELLFLYPLLLKEVAVVETHGPHLQGSTIIGGYWYPPKMNSLIVNYWTGSGQFATKAVTCQNFSADYLWMVGLNYFHSFILDVLSNLSYNEQVVCIL